MAWWTEIKTPYNSVFSNSGCIGISKVCAFNERCLKRKVSRTCGTNPLLYIHANRCASF
jgi:hypothetical protein